MISRSSFEGDITSAKKQLHGVFSKMLHINMVSIADESGLLLLNQQGNGFFLLGIVLFLVL